MNKTFGAGRLLAVAVFLLIAAYDSVLKAEPLTPTGTWIQPSPLDLGGNTTRLDASPDPWYSTTETSGLWWFRDPYFADNDKGFQGADAADLPELTTTASGLNTSKVYDVRVLYWNSSGGVSSRLHGDLLYVHHSGIGPGAVSLTPSLASNDSAYEEVIGSVGGVSSLQVDVEDYGGWSANRYIGVSFQEVGTNYVWDNSNGNLRFSTNQNWNADGQPMAATDFANIDNGDTVLIQTGDSVGARQLRIGTTAGTSGAVNMSNGTLTVSDRIALGIATGTTGGFTLSGGTVNSDSFAIGGLGAGTVTQGGGQLNLANTLYLGSNTGVGTYTLNAGDATVLKLESYGTGHMIMNGGTFTTTGTGNYLQIGSNASSVTDFALHNGTVTSDIMQIGYGTGSHGAVNMDGGILNVNNLAIGRLGTGELTQSGGQVNVASTFYLSNNEGTGTYTLNSGDATAHGFESYGTGHMIMNGGTFTTSGGGNYMQIGSDATSVTDLAVHSGTLTTSVMQIGYDPGSQGTVSMDGGTVNIATLALGRKGTGAFTQSGGQLNVSGTFYLPDNTGTGTYTLNSGDATTHGFESYGTGHMIMNGGTFTTSGAGNYMQIATDSSSVVDVAVHGGTLTTSIMQIGYDPGSQGTVSMDGGTVNIATLALGRKGTGAFTQSGGQLNVSGTFYLPDNTGTGTYTLNSGDATTHGFESYGTGHMIMNGGTFTTSGAGNYMQIATDSSSVVDVAVHGGTLTTSVMQIGAETGSQGTVTMDGGILNATTLTIGRKGTGTVTQSGGQVTATNMYIGDWPSSSGAYNISGGQLTVTTIGDPGSGGLATLNISGTGKVMAGTIIGNGAQTLDLNFTGGTLSALDIKRSLTNAGGRLDASASLIDVTGTSLIEGTYNQLSGGVLGIDIAGLSQGTSYDFFTITGTASLAGTINVSLLSFAPSTGSFFDILTAASITDTTSLTGASGFTKSIIAGGNGQILRLSYQPVPEPNSTLLTGIGLVGLSRFFRRKKAINS